MPIAEPTWPDKLTIRMQIMQEVHARLSRITKANGFQSNLGATVVYGQQTSPLHYTYPIAYYWDHFESPQQLSGTTVNSLQVQVESFELIEIPDEIANLPESTPEEVNEKMKQMVILGQQGPIIANQHLADVRQALSHDWRTGNYDVKFNGLAHGFAFLESDPFLPIQPAELMQCGLNSQWTITYQHANGDPYSLKR